MKKTIKNAMIGIIALALTLSCFGVQAGNPVIKAYDLGFTSVRLASGELVNLYPGQQLEIDAPATAFYFVDNLDYITGYNRTGDRHDPRPHIHLKDIRVILPRALLTAGLFVWIIRRYANNLSVFTRGAGIKIGAFDGGYPYLQPKIYPNTSLWTAMAGLWANRFDVEVVDLNIDSIRSRRARQVIKHAELFCFSPTGSPGVPGVLKICEQLKRWRPDTSVLIGGQWVEGLEPWEFDVLFAGTNAVQYQSTEDFRKVDIPPESVDNLFHHPMLPLLNRHPLYRDAYLKAPERALVVSRGCHQNCDFCGALHGVPEQFKEIGSFYTDLQGMVVRAKELGVEELEFYSTSLDFFQNPEQIATVLQCINHIADTENFPIWVRGLSCMNSYLRASRITPDFDSLVKRVRCMGFGVDGTDEEVWKRLNKRQNHSSDIAKVAELTKRHGMRFEILMFTGDPNSSVEALNKTERFTTALLDAYDHSVSRIHIAKVLPGSNWWRRLPLGVRLEFLCKPSLFYNLDVLACASSITHPDKAFRRAVNKMYLRFLWKERRKGRCVSSTIFPQGGKGLLPFLAKLANRFMPFDR